MMKLDFHNGQIQDKEVHILCCRPSELKTDGNVVLTFLPVLLSVLGVKKGKTIL